MEIPDKLICLLRNLYAGQEVTELDMEQWTGSKLGKEYVKAVYCHPAYLSYMQSSVQSLSHVQLSAVPWTVSQSLPKFMSIESVIPSNHLILLPSIFPSIRVISIESTLHIRWPKYQSFSFFLIQQMLAIWSLFPLPFLNPACTSGSSLVTNSWSLAWRILSMILLACEMHAIVW